MKSYADIAARLSKSGDEATRDEAIKAIAEIISERNEEFLRANEWQEVAERQRAEREEEIIVRVAMETERLTRRVTALRKKLSKLNAMDRDASTLLRLVREQLKRKK